MAYGPRQSLWRSLIVLHSFFRNQSWATSTPAINQHFPLIANKQQAIGMVQITAVFEFLGPWRKQAAIVGMHFYRRHVAAGWEFIVHDGRQRKCFLEYGG